MSIPTDKEFRAYIADSLDRHGLSMVGLSRLFGGNNNFISQYMQSSGSCSLKNARLIQEAIESLDDA